MGKLYVENRYGVVPNSVLMHKELSWKAKGLYWYIQSKPDDWNFAIERFEGKDGKDSTRAGIQELETFGYLQRIKRQKENGFFEVDYILYEKPTYGGFTVAENPPQENPSQENPPYIKEINTKKEKQNKSIIINPEKEFSEERFEYQVSKRFLEQVRDKAQIAFILKTKKENVLLQDWAKEIEKLQRIDGYQQEEILKVLLFALKDDFWSRQIISIKKLREKNKDWASYFSVLAQKIQEQTERPQEQRRTIV